MSKYAEIRKSTARGKYASGGRVADASGRPAKTVVNIVVPGGGMPQAAPAGPATGAPPAPVTSPSGGMPVPPQAAAMALNQMQGKPGMPGGFARGGRVKCADGGAASGVGRLENTRRQKRAGK